MPVVRIASGPLSSVTMLGLALVVGSGAQPSCAQQGGATKKDPRAPAAKGSPRNNFPFYLGTRV